MRKHGSTLTRGGVLAVLALATLSAALTGCGVGSATKQEQVSNTVDTYLRALADGDTTKACAQLTRRAKGDRCEQALKQRLSGLKPDALKHAADGSIDIDLHGDTATAGLSEPGGARFRLARVGRDWRIDSGYTLASATAARIPATPVGNQVAWALGQLNRGTTGLAQQTVTAHFSPEFLTVVMRASDLVTMSGQTWAGRGPFTFTGFAYPPTATQAVALIEPKTGERGSLRIKIGGTPTRIVGLEVTEAPPAIKTTGRYSGRFDIDGRKLFLHCTGSGGPTVVFQGGLTTDWVEVQNRVAPFTRACSYDPANGPWGRSDAVPTPRTGKDVVADLHALLAAAKVPGPYVLAGHSDGGSSSSSTRARTRTRSPGSY